VTAYVDGEGTAAERAASVRIWPPVRRAGSSQRSKTPRGGSCGPTQNVARRCAGGVAHPLFRVEKCAA